ncbi:oligosaccharide flippase family protein [Campylobacter californiensis]|uniref:oligosaccharide flippase family protein n=1 Tax=Campylobacter californiensis TaxID=1032243 RepID=UPI001475DA42|nr:oligosaccharide flippase family protein [Campylobacter sp. RM12916]MBE3609029.1 oligosaccharide flippase family protein [Campylobacter sp. RM12916]
MINKELLVVVIGRVLQIIIALISIKIATRFLEPIEMGNYYLIMSIIGFYSFFLINPIGQYINRHIHQWHKEKKLMNVFYIYNFYITLVSFFVLFFTYVLYELGIGDNIEMFYFVLFISLYIYFNTWNQTMISIINLLGNRVTFVLFAVITQIFGLLFSIYFIKYWNSKGIFWTFGQAAGFGLVAVFLLLYFIKKVQSNFSASASLKMISSNGVKNILKFSFPLYLGVVFLWMQNQSYGVIIEKYISAEFLGYFGVGISLAFAIFGAFEAIVMQYFYPAMYDSMNDENEFKDVINNMLNLVIPLYFALALFVSFLSFYFIKILVADNYFEAYIYTIFGAWISFFRASANIIANIAHAKMDTKKLIIPYVVGGILSVVCVFIATQSENYNILVPVALLLASFIGFFTMYLNMNKLVRIYIKVKIFITVFLYSLPLLISVYFYEYSHQIIYSISILSVYGIYFLFLMYIIIKKRGVVVE